jgi:xanthine dehydrogenase accessory factor
VLAAPRLAVFGVSPVARAVAQLGKAMGYLIDIVDPEANAAELPIADRVITELAAPELRAGPQVAFVVVASMGEHDEDAVAAALAMRPAYLGVVASRKRFAVLRQTLLERGVSAHALDTITSPAGLDLGGRLPEEVALSILAEIVQRKHAAVAPARTAGALAIAADAPAAPAAPVTAIDPVCHMTVTVATARHVATWDARRWYFCNPRCKDKFLAEPARFLEPAATSTAPGAGR